MNKEQLEKLLQQRASSPTPALHPDPFLATRIRALAEKNGEASSLFAGLSWRTRSVLAAAALLLGIYVGGQLSLSGTVQSDPYTDPAFSSLASALNQTALSDNLEAIFLPGEEAGNE